MIAAGASGAYLIRGRSPGAPGAPPAAATSVAPAASTRAPQPIEVAETIYDGKLWHGWEDWGWGPHDLPASGPARVVFAGYGGIALRTTKELPARFGALVFRFKAPASWGEFLSVTLKRGSDRGDEFPVVSIRQTHLLPQQDGWKEALVSWKELNPKAKTFDRVVISARRQVGKDWVLLDHIVLTKSPGPQNLTITGPTRDATLAIRCDAPTRPISPLIYGVTNGVWATGATANRIGGNPLTRFNWDLGNAWNTGSDWFFENVKVDGGLQAWLDDSVKHRAKTALVVPTIGWVAKDTTSVAFPVSQFGKQRKHDPHRPEAGDGFRPDGTPIPPGPPTQTSVAATPEVIGRWIRRLREWDAARGERAVHIYILDNEPTLWDVTHRDVHPEPLTYDELLDRTIRYASAIRQADPEGFVAGPAEWGWTGYHYSAKDRASGFALPRDRLLHGNVPLVPWWLRKLAEHEKRTGERLVHYLDLHFYPAPDGIYGTNARTDPEGAALRLRTTRALWDPTYKDESWIKEAVRLIPRMKEWVDENYPGTKTMIGEWSFGAEGHISGGLATAEALGRFGQQGLDAAFFWGGPKEGTPAFWAFRAFRNFDGKGGRFLDVSLQTKEAQGVSLFASQDTGRTKLVAILLNLHPKEWVEADIELTGCGGATSYRAFSYGPSSTGLAAEEPGAPAGSRLQTYVGPYSIKVLEIQVKPPAK